MKNQPFLIFSILIFFILGCQSNDENTIVKQFITAYNSKDSIKTMQCLHEDFKEYFDDEVTIDSKKNYANNYAWGKVMNDKEVIEITSLKDSLGFEIVETMSTYYSDRDKLLTVKPYKSKRTYFVKDGQIYKIIGSEYDGYEAYNKSRTEKYNAFFDWLDEKHGLGISSFPFTTKGAEDLKLKIMEYKDDKKS